MTEARIQVTMTRDEAVLLYGWLSDFRPLAPLVASVTDQQGPTVVYLPDGAIALRDALRPLLDPRRHARLR